MENTPKFTLKRKCTLIPIEQEDGSILDYEVRRVSGADIEAYLDENSGRIETAMGMDGKVQIKQIKTYKSMFVSLLKYCLFLEDKKVIAPEIAKLPYDVQKGLFEEAQTINGLNDIGAEQAKN